MHMTWTGGIHVDVPVFMSLGTHPKAPITLPVQSNQSLMPILIQI